MRGTLRCAPSSGTACEVISHCWADPAQPRSTSGNRVFRIVFILLGLIADFVLPLWWALVATIPIGIVSWWVAYRSEWF